MHTRTLKKLGLALTLWLALHTSMLRAQILGPYTESASTFEFDANGVLWDTGTGTGSLSLAGPGTRMFWYPAKAAFRAGYVDSTEWNASSIGSYSAAFGYGTTASGTYAFAAGYQTRAAGRDSVTFGYQTTASLNDGVALGYQTTASNYASVATGAWTYAGGYISTASGESSYATGTVATANGAFNLANGSYSLATGYQTTASGYASIAGGLNSAAWANYSMALGYNTQNSSFVSMAIGQYNLGLSATGGTPSLTLWQANDPLFEIGDGTSSSARSDALVVYKNGNVQAQGSMRCSPGGDLTMGSFTAGTLP